LKGRGLKLRHKPASKLSSGFSRLGLPKAPPKALESAWQSF
jgi:hypothetical protein